MASSHSFKTPPLPPPSLAGMNAIVYPTVTYRNARAAIEWLGQAFGFESLAVHPREGGEVAYAELVRPPGDTDYGSREFGVRSRGEHLEPRHIPRRGCTTAGLIDG